MKHTPNRRQRDFLQICRQILRASDNYLTISELARRAMSKQAHGYYIDEDYAYRLILDRLNHGKIPIRRSTRLLCDELIARIEALRVEDPSANIARALKTVLESGYASRFFMELKTARNLINLHYKYVY